ncbi:MAG: hypothetical protein Q8L22_08635 [Reyranella sp.]|nr:hypothetical protein [Reyranella sp.]
MATINSQFADEVKRIGLVNGTVRIELGILAATDEGHKPSLEPSGILVMSLEGFLRSAATIDAFREELVAKGLVQREAKPNPLEGLR